MANVFARGVSKIVTIAPETTFGVASSAAGQQLRRTSSDLNLNMQEIQSQEILVSQQVRDSRNGPRQVQGTISGQISPGTYSQIFEAMLRGTLTAGVTGASVVGTLTADATSGVLTLTAATDFGAAGFRIGDIVRMAGLPSGAAIDNGVNLVVIAVGTTTIQFEPGPASFSVFSAQTETLAVSGKKLIMPATNQVDRSFTIEHWYADTGSSEVFTGCKPTQIAVNVTSSGFATMQASFTGQNMTTSTSRYFSGAAAQTSTTGVTGTSGRVSYNGTSLAYIMGFNLQIAAQIGADPVVGSNLIPQIFLGTNAVRGSFTALSTADTMTADFLNENELTMGMLLTSSPAPGSDFVNFTLPRAKLTSSTKSDSDRAITRSYNFTGLENASYANRDFTSIVYQDSAA